MSASAKPAEKVLKSFLAAVLAVSLCPLTPDKAQAQETSGGGVAELTASPQVVDESAGGVINPSGDNLGPAAESDSSDDDDIASATSISGKWTTSGTCQWAIDSDGCLTIEPLPGVASGKLGSHSWAEEKDRITSVIIKSKVVSSSDDCRNMFSDFTNLEKADLSGLDTSNATDMSGMFYRCISLISLDVSKFDTSNVTDMSHMFYLCEKPISLDVSKFDTSNVTDMSEMFSCCRSLRFLDVSHFDTSSVTDMSWMFAYCSGLTSLDVSKFDTSSVTDMSWMFAYSGGFNYLDVSKFDTSSVTDMSRMFYDCENSGGWKGIVTLDVSHFDTSSVTDMSWMFGQCTVLEEITGLSSLDTSSVTDMSGMFGGCRNLKSLDVSHFDTSSVTDMGWMFDGCRNLKSLDVSHFDTSNVADMSWMFASVKAPLDLLPFDTSNVAGMRGMFSGYGEEGGVSLDLSKFDTSSVVDMGAMFRNYNLAALDISSFNTTNVKCMGDMFKGCKYIKQLDLSKFDTSGVSWKQLSFVGDGVSSVGLEGMMDGCSRLEEITFGRNFDWTYNSSPSYTTTKSYLPTPDSKYIQDADGKWYAGSTGRPFSPSEVPSKTAETYYASKTLVPPYKVAFAMYSEDDNSLSFYKRYSGEVPFKSDGQFDGKTISALFCAHDYGGVEEYSGDRPWADYAGSIKKVIVVDDGIRPKSTSEWFRGMRSLTSIDVRKLDTSRDTDMYCMFQSCPVRTLDLSSFDTSCATEMRAMLDCPNLCWLKLGDKFSFNGQGASRQCSPSKPSFANATGLWVSSLDGKTYASTSIPNNVAATYTAQIKDGIEKNPLEEGMFEVDTAAKTYTGSPIEPGVSSPALDEGADYEVSYRDNTQAGTATVVVSGRGDYSGELEYEFRIDPKRVEAPEAAAGLVYSGGEQVGVAASGDYEVSGGSAMNAGDYTATVSLGDKRNYVWGSTGDSGDLEIPWSIAKATPSYAAPAAIEATFGQTLGDIAPSLPAGFSWRDDPSTGVGGVGEREFAATFTPEDAANYDAVENVPVTVRVSAARLSAGMFEVDTAAKTYTGSPIEPGVSSPALDEGADYEVSYRDNTQAGTATVVVSGRGDYSGELEYEFRIDPKRVEAPEAAAGLVYSGGEQVGVAASGDYEVSGGSAMNAGDYTATVSLGDKRNYVWGSTGDSGDLEIPWSIAKATPSYAAPAAIEATFGQTLGDIAPSLPAGFSWRDDPSTGVGGVGEREFAATFTPEDAANYDAVENVPVTVRVSAARLSAGMFEVDTAAKTYTGSPIEPGVSSPALDEGADYEVSYRDNTQAGTATVVVSGRGDYSGELEYEFRIDPKRVEAPEAAAGLVYSGGEQVGVAASGDYEVSGGSAMNAGDYTATVSLGDKRNYVWGSTGDSGDLEIPWSIAKATPSYAAPAAIEATFGQTLGDIAPSLPAGFSWRDDPSTGVGGVGEREFAATFTPEDAANYDAVENVPVTVRVSAARLSAGMFEVDTAAKTYTGSPIEPGVSSPALDEGADYEVSYRDNTQAGTATVVVSGRGDYSGELEYEFRIDPKRVEAPEAAAGLVYSGGEQVGVAASGDYEVSGGSAMNAGDYTATVSLGDKRNYVWGSTGDSGDLEIPWSIAKATPSYAAPAAIEATFGQTLGDIAPSLPAGFSWRDDPSTGVGGVGEREFAATFTPEDAANYDAVENVPVTVRVSAARLSAGMFEVDTAAKTYTGSPIEPGVSSPALDEGADYEVSYRDNTQAGTATVVVSGRGDYSGELEYEFRIDPKRVEAPEAAAGLVYSGGEQVGVAASGDYEVSGGSAMNAGDYTATVSLGDKRNYVWGSTGDSGDLEIPWSIAKADMGSASISPIGKQAWTGSQLTPEPVVTFNGKSLAEGEDYTLSYGENVNPGKGTVTVSATEGGNFTGSATVYFDIEKKAEPVNPDPGTGGGTDPDPGTGGGGGAPAPAPEPQQFAVTYHLDGGVNAASNPATFTAGAAVALAAPTREGYEFLGWYADAALTKLVTEISADASGDVELWAGWAKKAAPAPTFPDVDYSESSWYGDAVTYVASKGLITGYDSGDKAGFFGVGDTLTRAQLATILWRNACPEEAASYDPATAKDETGIAGSADGQYYTAAANWAVKNGVISGYVREDGSHDFAANDDVSFEQLVTILARLCATDDELAAAGSDLSAFADGGDASGWSRAAFAWAAGKGLVQGYDTPSGKMLSPGEDVARERVAVVLMRAFEMGLLK